MQDWRLDITRRVETLEARSAAEFTYLHVKVNDVSRVAQGNADVLERITEEDRTMTIEQRLEELEEGKERACEDLRQIDRPLYLQCKSFHPLNQVLNGLERSLKEQSSRLDSLQKTMNAPRVVNLLRQMNEPLEACT